MELFLLFQNNYYLNVETKLLYLALNFLHYYTYFQQNIDASSNNKFFKDVLNQFQHKSDSISRFLDAKQEYGAATVQRRIQKFPGWSNSSHIRIVCCGREDATGRSNFSQMSAYQWFALKKLCRVRWSCFGKLKNLCKYLVSQLKMSTNLSVPMRTCSWCRRKRIVKLAYLCEFLLRIFDI